MHQFRDVSVVPADDDPLVGQMVLGQQFVGEVGVVLVGDRVVDFNAGRLVQRLDGLARALALLGIGGGKDEVRLAEGRGDVGRELLGADAPRWRQMGVGVVVRLLGVPHDQDEFRCHGRILIGMTDTLLHPESARNKLRRHPEKPAVGRRLEG
jgi:hypothetical protein